MFLVFEFILGVWAIQVTITYVSFLDIVDGVKIKLKSAPFEIDVKSYENYITVIWE